jgi:UDP-N-acetylmuramoyl-tripeptide--D-alanyl-D-alanine ligase
MKEFSIQSLSRIINARPIKDSGVFTSVNTDSRNTRDGDCFFAIAGENFDGHEYVNDAFAKGAVCAVVGKDVKISKGAGKIVLRVEDTIKALGDFAAEYRWAGNFKVVAITGSVGKTTTRQIIYHVLSQHFRVVQSPKSFNNNIGVPLTLLSAEPEDEIIISELGSNHPGEIGYLTRIAQPDIAIVINVHPAHLEGFGNIETIAKEKVSICEGLRDGGVFFVNGDFEVLVDTCRSKGIAFKTFGKSKKSDIKATKITGERFSSRFTINGTEIVLPLPGAGNVENALAAWAVCSQLGLTSDSFADDVRTLKSVAMRAELLQIGKLTVLSDCYNANPASMKNALEILAGLGSDGKRRTVFICGDMAELGGQSEELHRELGGFIAKTKVQLLLATGKFSKTTAQAAKKAAGYDLQTEIFEDTISVCNNLQKFIKDTDIILVKGSRTAKLEKTVDKLKEIFS